MARHPVYELGWRSSEKVQNEMIILNPYTNDGLKMMRQFNIRFKVKIL